MIKLTLDKTNNGDNEVLQSLYGDHCVHIFSVTVISSGTPYLGYMRGNSGTTLPMVAIVQQKAIGNHAPRYVEVYVTNGCNAAKIVLDNGMKSHGIHGFSVSDRDIADDLNDQLLRMVSSSSIIAKQDAFKAKPISDYDVYCWLSLK